MHISLSLWWVIGSAAGLLIAIALLGTLIKDDGRTRPWDWWLIVGGLACAWFAAYRSIHSSFAFATSVSSSFLIIVLFCAVGAASIGRQRWHITFQLFFAGSVAIADFFLLASHRIF